MKKPTSLMKAISGACEKPKYAHAVCVSAAPIKPEEIVAYRKKMNLTQAEFAAQLGISTRVLQSWELADRKPSMPSQELLRRALAC